MEPIFYTTKELFKIKTRWTIKAFENFIISQVWADFSRDFGNCSVWTGLSPDADRFTFVPRTAGITNRWRPCGFRPTLRRRLGEIYAGIFHAAGIRAKRDASRAPFSALPIARDFFVEINPRKMVAVNIRQEQTQIHLTATWDTLLRHWWFH